jgi:RHS repeat-associated protein
MKQVHRLGALVLSLATATVAQGATQFSTVDYSLYPGDFNGDGRTDLLYIGKTPDKVNGIALGDASGAPQLGFQSWPATYLGLPWSTGQFVPAIGDFNGDGKSDVLMQSATAGTTYVLLANTNTGVAPVGQLVGIHQGISQTAFGIEWSADKHKLHVGDFDANGSDDVLLQATNKGGTNAIVLTANSGGLFTTSTSNCWAGGPQQCWTDGEQGFLWSTQSSILHVGKFNSDLRSDILVQGRPDFVLIPFDDLSIPIPVFRPLSFGIFLAQAPDGAGRIIRTPNQLWNHNDLGGNWSPLNRNLIVGDFNGDGYADILIQAQAGGATNMIATGTSNGTVGTATALTNQAAGWTGDAYNVIVGRFGNSSSAVLYLQATTAGGSNYYTGNITGGSVSTTTSALQTAATLPAPATTVGATPASADVTPNGTAAYTIPIALPKGTAGLTPSLSLSYSSSAGNGLVGVGWNLSGLGIIARCPKTLAQDGVVQDVQLVTADEYCLDGNRLRLVQGSGSQGAYPSEYRTELETFSRIKVMATGTQGPQWFQVETKDGLVYEYGATPDSRIPVPGSSVARVWALSKVRDRDFNNWTVTYTNDTANGSYRPDRIDYTANSQQSTAAPYRVKFYYEARNAGEQVVNYYQGGFVNQTQRLQRVELQTSGGAALIRKYVLAYEAGSSFNNVSRLASVQECATSTCSVAMAATTLSWSDQAASGNAPAFDLTTWRFNPYTSGPSPDTVAARQAPDLNGDGIPDAFIMYAYQHAGYTGGYSYQLGARHGQAAPAMVNLPWQHTLGYEVLWNTHIDWDADGKDDIITSRGGTLWWLHGKPDGTIAYELFPGAPADVAIGTLQIDVDGDGYRDAVNVVAGTNTTPGTNGSVQARFHRRDVAEGYEATTYTLWTPAAGTKIASVAASTLWVQYMYRTLHTSADIDGDGRHDLVVQMDNGWRVLYSSGTSYTTGELLATTYQSQNASYATPTAIDVNGDGCTDFIYPTTGGWKLATSGCRRSGGTGLNAAVTLSMIGASSDWITSAADVNGDGYQDFATSPGFNAQAYLLLSTGTSLSTAATLPAFNNGFLTSMMDIDGDGVADGTLECGASWYYTPPDTCDASAGALAAIGPKPNLLLTATDGFGKQTQFSYAPLTDPAVYTRGNTGIGKTQDTQGALYVVKQMVMSDGVGGTYSQHYAYQGAKRHIAGRGSLGFSGRTITDSRTGFVTQETFNNHVANDGTQWELVGTLAQSVVRQYAGGPIVSELTQQWSSLAPDGASNRRYPYVSQSVAKKYELAGPNSAYITATTATTVDNYGTPYNVTTVITEGITGLNLGSSHTHTVYTPLANILNDTTNWCIARPTRIEDTRGHTLTDGGQITRVTEQTWNGPKCRLTNTVIEPGSSWALNTAIEYDVFNNVNRTTVTGNNIPTAIVTEANYGANGHLLQWEENAVDHRTNFTSNVNLGLPATRTDPNGLLTTWTYDDFGREIRMTRPDGTSTFKTYHRCETANNYCGDTLLRYAIRTSERNTLDGEINYADQFFDVMGRVKFEQKVGFSGQTIGLQMLYDNRGNVALKSNPFFVGTGSVSGQSYTYDFLNRLVRTDRPVSDVDRTVVSEWLIYNGLTTTAIDALGRTQTKVASAWGTVVQATDEAIQHTKYTYNAFGDLRTVTSPPITGIPAGIVTTIAYNVRGFKIGSNDPDMGSWTYTYDALGRLLTQVDAKLQTTAFTYDVLGRTKTREDHPGGVSNRTTWMWDPLPYGRGLLSMVTSPDGYREEYVYDNQSRPSSATTTANGTNFVMDYAYDASTGRLVSTTYPDSGGTRLTVQHNYNQYGFLKDVRESGAPTPLWQATAEDALGHVTREEFANGHVTNLGFDQTNGRLYSVQTGLSGSPPIQSLSYHWDAVGNLVRRTEGLQYINETFTYDANYRLATVSRNGSVTLTMAYDEVGNVLNKSNAGSYVYVNQTGCTPYAHTQPHAVRKVGTNVYCYDANGNMVSRSGSSVTWSTFNYPTQINQAGGNTSTFYYGASRNAYRQISVDAGTTEDRITVGDGAFEQLTRNGGAQTEFRHFVVAHGRVVAIVKRSAQTGNKTFYPHADHLGSTDLVSDETGQVYLRTSFDAWGQRRGGSWAGPPTAPEKTAINASTHRGYTGHEQLDNLNLVHMKGRVYDPVIARFMSADPIIQSPFRSQSFNRYSYVWNNPLNSTDPTGLTCSPLGVRIKQEDGCTGAWATVASAPSVKENGQSVDRAHGVQPTSDAANNSAEENLSAFEKTFVEMLSKEHFRKALLEHLDARRRLIETLDPASRAEGFRDRHAHAREAKVEIELRRLDREFFGYFEFPGYGIEPGPVEEFLGLGGIVRSLARDAARSTASALLLEKQLVSQAQMAEVLHGGGRVMAGAGVRREIDDLPRLIDQYGGDAADWTKITSSTYKTRAGELLETHAYRNVRTGEIVELKSKLP